MLTLTRYEGQRIYLTPDNGQAIVVQVVEIHGSKVVLRFDAPRDVRIMREELLPAEERRR